MNAMLFTYISVKVNPGSVGAKVRQELWQLCETFHRLGWVSSGIKVLLDKPENNLQRVALRRFT